MHSPPRVSEPFRKRLEAFTRFQDSVYARDAEALHRTRVAPSIAQAAVLATAQDLLGRLHDLEVLSQRARQTQASSPLLVHAWRERGKLIRALEGDCRALHARYIGNHAQLVAIAGQVTSLAGDATGNRRAG